MEKINQNKWLKSRLSLLNISQKSFMNTLGLREQHFGWLENKPKQQPEVLHKMAKILQCNPQKLLLFWDNKITENELWDNNFTKENVTADIVQIDVLDVRACCGNGVENFTENVIGQQMMTLPALRELTSSAPENIKIIKAIGESMMPTIHTDDIVWIDISVKTPTSDGLYILCVGSDLLIRRIQINPFDNTATVIADNNKYLPIPRQNYRDINVVGKVIYHMRKTA